MKLFYLLKPGKKLYPILGEATGAQRAGFYTLVLGFSALMGMMIFNRELVDHRIIAIASILIYFLTLYFIYIVRKSMIDKLDETTEILKIMKTTDELTRAFNRKHFNILFEKELDRARRHEGELSCLALDIDNFKKINNKYGHQTGDEILQDISELIKDNLRITDIQARYGDNRFICLLPDTNLEQSINFSKRMRHLLDGKKIIYRTTNEVIQITMSIGIAVCKPRRDNDLDSNRIISMAEKALEHAKKSGGNTVQHYSDTLVDIEKVV
jgi:diguanylate cyclase (GGDEF)-like protein